MSQRSPKGNGHFIDEIATRRGALGWIGRALTGLAAGGMALASGQPILAAGGSGSVRPAPPKPIFLPPGRKAAQPTACGTCGGTAEYVCSSCCQGNTCCSGSLYRQLCYDTNCNPYYTYWCA